MARRRPDASAGARVGRPGPRRVPALHLAFLALALAGCDGLYDPDDCRENPDLPCEAYRPEGLLCGLVEMEDLEFGVALHGTACNGHNPFLESGPGGACPDPDTGPAWYERVQTRQDPVGLVWNHCTALGNDARSTGDLGEVPAGATCGMASVHSVSTSRPCQGVHPLRDGRCPEGFTLRYALDRYRECPEAQPPLPDPVACERPSDLPVPTVPGCDGEGMPDLGHLVAWCERDDGGCSDCGHPDDVICGLHAPDGPTDPLFWRRLRWEELGPEACAAMQDERARQQTVAARCQGRDVAAEGCPPGMDRSCLHDALGEGTLDEQAFCFCSTGALIAE